MKTRFNKWWNQTEENEEEVKIEPSVKLKEKDAESGQLNHNSAKQIEPKSK